MLPDPPDVLLRKAQGDLRLLSSIVNSTDATDEHVGFHAQQVVEKSVKSVLVRNGLAYRKTHDLHELVGLLARSAIPFPAALGESHWLTAFAAQFRYDDLPESTDPASSFNRVEALRLAAIAVEWATRTAEG